MRRNSVSVLAFLVVGLSACTRELDFKLHQGPARVYELGTNVQFRLAPGSESHRELVAWLAANESGWDSFRATPPLKGTVIRVPGLEFQFVDGSVIAHTEDGSFTKRVAPSALPMAVALMASAATGAGPGISLRVAPTGVAREGCGNLDGPAVEFVFKVAEALPTIGFADATVPYTTLTFKPPLVGNQELRVRLNTTLDEVKHLRAWRIPGNERGFEAWVCPVNGYPCDFAMAGTVASTRAAGDVIDGQFRLTFESGNVATGNFSAKLLAPIRAGMCRDSARIR